MSATTRRFAAVASMAAALSLAATPAHGADLPRNQAITPGKVHDAEAEDAARHGWGGYPYGYPYRYRHHRGPRTGDVIAGILVLGTLAAIAGSAQKNRERAEPYPDRDPYPQDRNYRTPRGERFDGGGIGRAVDMCLDEVERMRGRVDRVENAARRGDGWFVGGQLEGGEAFSCRIDNDGRISDVQLGRDAYQGAAASGAAAPQAEQWTDEDYAEARRETNAAPEGRAPAYPGGLYQGESGAEQDGRYSLSEAPDFSEG